MKDELIEKLSNLIRADEASESDVDHLMTLIRKLQERTSSDTRRYPLLNFFCDWTKHTTLSWKPARAVVVDLNERLYRIKDIQDNDAVIRELSQVISFERLQEELTQFLSNYGLPNDLVTKKKSWLRFVILLINIVSDCALELPENHRGAVINSIKEGVVAVSLRFTWAYERIFTQRKTDERVWTLVITLSDTTHIVVPCKVFGLYLTSKAAAEVDRTAN